MHIPMIFRWPRKISANRGSIFFQRSRDEIEVELAAWLKLLQEKARDLGQVELALADSDKSEQLSENHKKMVLLAEEKSALIERVRQVVDVANSKGRIPKALSLM